MTNAAEWRDLYLYQARAAVDWTHKVAQARGKTRTVLEKTISNTNSRELLMIADAEKTADVPDVRVSKIFQLKNKKWIHAGYQCMECQKVFSDEEVRANHKYVCRRINTLVKKHREKEE